MEHFEKALAKAKGADLKEGTAAKAGKPPAAKPEAAKKAAAKKAAASPRRRGMGNAAQIDYHTTRISPLNEAHLNAHKIVAHNKQDKRSGSFDLLRTQLLHVMAENGWRTVGITSPTPSCGKSVVGINLACSIAHVAEQTALLVDCDLRRPSVARYLGLEPGPDIQDYFSGDQEISEVLVNPGIDRLTVLPTNKPIPGAAELLASSQAREMVSELKDRYDDRTIIFDLPPLLLADDVLAFLPNLDCVILVAETGKSTTAEIEECTSQLSRTNLACVVMNKSIEGTGSYAYGYY